MKFAIYDDYIHNNGLLYRRLKLLWPQAGITSIDADDISAGRLKNVDMLVMPGGADLYFCEKLDKKANQSIQDWVNNGGRYLGICAGAYYACSKIFWAEREEKRILEARELRLSEFEAVGPIYEYIHDGDFTKSWDGIAELKSDKGILFNALYRGGCRFRGEDPDAEILARYNDIKDRPAAIIYKKMGRGHVVLCGPHIEFTSEFYLKGLYRHDNDEFDYQFGIIESLKRGDEENMVFWREIDQRFFGDKP